jgi:MoCo/4Fe-4S cofactor protein with predicted Tat translocation signal
MKRKAIDPELLRDRLSVAQGKQYWRSLEELADEPRFREMLEREFAADSSTWTDDLSRRKFLTLMGASLALAGLSGCRPPTGQIVPYVRQPENMVLGKPLYFATAMTISGFATGLLVESHEGRPTKIEGNPDHPASLGATTVNHQAAILDMYDPDRSQTVLFREQARDWNSLVADLQKRLNQGKKPADKGDGLVILSEAIGSPTLQDQKKRFLAAYPKARWIEYEPVHHDNALEGTRLAFGKPYHRYYDLRKADVIVSFADDFLGFGPGQLAYTRQFADRRRPVYDEKTHKLDDKKVGGERGMNRLYVFETDVTITGSKADHRLAVKPSEILNLALALAAELKIEGATAPTDLDATAKNYIEAIARDLLARKPGSSLILAGDGQPPEVHAIVHAINDKLGNNGVNALFTEPLPFEASNSYAELDKLITDIDQGKVSTLLVLGGNPVYTSQLGLQLHDVLKKQLLEKDLSNWMAVHVGPYFDETARLCHWHVPQTHFLEEWSDGVAYDGTACIVQPLIAPLYRSKSLHEVISALTFDPATAGSEVITFDDRPGLELVKSYWQANLPESAKKEPFETFWQKAVEKGVIPGTKKPTVKVTLQAGLFGKDGFKPRKSEGYELFIAPEPGVYDGRFANNGWLQEWPRPVTRLSWENALLMSPATANKLGLGSKLTDWTYREGGGAGELSQRVGQYKGGEHGETIVDQVEIETTRGKLRVPVWILPGHADDAFTLYLGYGRGRMPGDEGIESEVLKLKVCNGIGVNAGRLRGGEKVWWVTLKGAPKKTGTQVSLACQQGHFNMAGRDLVRSGTLDEYTKNPKFATSEEAVKDPYMKSLRHLAKEVREDQEKVAKNDLEAKKTSRYELKTTLFGSDFPYPGYRWGMAVDLSACTGCGACVIACQAENNIPVVGKEQVLRGREMHWIRIDRYFETPRGDGKEGSKAKEHRLGIHFQPVMCQHCEQAPCEPVCPVTATVHGDEGTNDMVYNRCLGTRYCANNCPYKVRRFNFLTYTDYDTPSLKLMYNPEVTVRTRGVMEKCTFCIQRISYARIEAAREFLDEQAWEQRTGKKKPEKESRHDRPGNGPDGKGRQELAGGEKKQKIDLAYIRDGEVVTACQAACPAEAIVFGDLNDKYSKVHHLHEAARRYDLLGELGTRPRVVYLAGLRNPNPELEAK